MGVRDYQNGWLATLTLFALASALITRIRRYVPKVYPALQCALALLLVGQVIQYSDKESFTHVNPWHESITKTAQQLEPESLVFTASDSASSLFAFVQVAHATRPDLAVVVRQHVFRSSSTGPTFRRLEHALKGWQPGAQLESLVHLNGTWPLTWEWADGLNASSKPPLSESAFPFMARGQTQSSNDLKKWQHGTTNKLWTQRPQFVQSIALSNVAMASANGKSGSHHLAEALLWDSDNHLLWLRYAALLTSEGNLDSAQEVVHTALKRFPDDLAFTEQKLRILIARNQFKNAIEFAAQLPETRRQLDANILGLLGICYANLTDYAQAAQYFDKALQINPNQYEAQLYKPRVDSLLKK